MMYLYSIFPSKGPILYVPSFCVTNAWIGDSLSFPNICIVTPSNGGDICPATILMIFLF